MEELGLPQKLPSGPAEKPAAPAEKPSGAPAKKPAPAPQAPPSPVATEAAQKPAEGAVVPAVKPGEVKPETKIPGIPTQKELRSMSFGQLLGKLMESASRLVSSFQNFFKGFTEKAEQKMGDRFSDEELKKIAVDLEKDKDKVYPSQDKAVEYVSTVLGLRVKDSPEIFLHTLKNSGLAFETDPVKIKDLQPGDVLFFKKKNEKGEAYAYTCAVVSGVEPLKMKMIPRTGGKPQELTVQESDYFKNEWFGFVKMPGKEAPPANEPAQPAAIKPLQPVSKETPAAGQQPPPAQPAKSGPNV